MLLQARLAKHRIRLDLHHPQPDTGPARPTTIAKDLISSPALLLRSHGSSHHVIHRRSRNATRGLPTGRSMHIWCKLQVGIDKFPVHDAIPPFQIPQYCAVSLAEDINFEASMSRRSGRGSGERADASADHPPDIQNVIANTTSHFPHARSTSTTGMMRVCCACGYALGTSAQKWLGVCGL